MTDIALHIDDARAKRNVMVLVLAQAFLGSQMAMMFVVGGLGRAIAGQQSLLCHLADFADRAGVHAGGHVRCPWRCRNAGRRPGSFWAPGRCDRGASSAPMACISPRSRSSCWAVPDRVSICPHRGFTALPPPIPPRDDFRPKAISYVMAGGLASAVIGPQLVKADVSRRCVDPLPWHLSRDYRAQHRGMRFCFCFSTSPSPARPLPTTPEAAPAGSC